jgi:uncharacterized protein YuzE
VKLTYDLSHNVAYLQLRKQEGKLQTIQVSNELNVDPAEDGRVFGIEFLSANAQLVGADRGALVPINQATGDRREIPLAPS